MVLSFNSPKPIKGLDAFTVKQNRGDDFLRTCKFAYDPTNGTMYVKVNDEADANLMAGRSFEVAGERMSFYHILNISVRSEEEDIYQTVKCRQLFPDIGE